MVIQKAIELYMSVLRDSNTMQRYGNYLSFQSIDFVNLIFLSIFVIYVIKEE